MLHLTRPTRCHTAQNIPIECSNCPDQLFFALTRQFSRYSALDLFWHACYSRCHSTISNMPLYLVHMQRRADSGYLIIAKDVAPAKQSDPVSPEVKAMHVGLKDVADVLLSALPVDSQGSLKIKQGDATYTNLTPTQDGAMINLTTFICQNQPAMWGSFLSLLSPIQPTCSPLSFAATLPWYTFLDSQHFKTDGHTLWSVAVFLQQHSGCSHVNAMLSSDCRFRMLPA